jgi:hypothetical protein
MAASYYTGMFAGSLEAKKTPPGDYLNSVLLQTCPVTMTNAPFENAVFLFKQQRFGNSSPYITRVLVFQDVTPGLVKVMNFDVDALDICTMEVPTMDWSSVGVFKCNMALTRHGQGNTFAGEAVCPPTKGNAYDMHTVVLGDGWYNNWSRGYYADGQRAWGLHHPIKFIKIGPEFGPFPPITPRDGGCCNLVSNPPPDCE